MRHGNPAGKHGKQTTSVGRIVGRVILALIAFMIVGGAFAALVISKTWLQDLPEYADAEAYNGANATIVYASDGETELGRFQLEYREPLQDISAISPLLLNATVATEDERFYEHNGVDPIGIARAIVNNLRGGTLEGASTITQQFVRNTVLFDEMNEISLKRKVREAYISCEVEKIYSKDKILLMYLNTINYGQGAYGIEAASHRYFSKDAIDLTLPEAALLAGIPQSPLYNDPVAYPDHALDRRNVVLNRMLSNGYISQEEYDEALATPIELNLYYDPNDGIYRCGYFTSYVRSLLYNDYGLTRDDILRGGLEVITTLDIDMQAEAEGACEAKRQSMGGGLECALAAIEPNTGYIKAIVGGRDYDASEVNIATGQGAGGRPCGSSFKTFTLVAAIEQGINPSTRIDCTSPATVNGYKVENYDNIDYGIRTISSAFAVSSNTGHVRLEGAIGVDKVAEVAHRMGIDSVLDTNRTGLALTLGVENVTPLEMAEAYAVIASGGIHYEPTPILTITDQTGKVLVDKTDPEQRAERVLSPEVACAAEKVMEGVVTYGTGTGARLPNGQPVAGKTGTTDDYKDITFVGITPQLSVSIWCGDLSNTTSVRVGTGCTDVFRMFAGAVLAGQEVQRFPQAPAPQYKPYTNVYYHIGAGFKEEKDEDEDEDKDKDKDKDEDKDKDKPDKDKPDKDKDEDKDKPDGDKPNEGDADNPGGDSGDSQEGSGNEKPDNGQGDSGNDSGGSNSGSEKPKTDPKA